MSELQDPKNYAGRKWTDDIQDQYKMYFKKYFGVFPQLESEIKIDLDNVYHFIKVKNTPTDVFFIVHLWRNRNKGNVKGINIYSKLISI